MKKWIFRLGNLGAAVVIAALVVVFLSLNFIVKRGVETIGPQIVKVDVKLGGANISPFSGSGLLSGLVVGNPPGYKSASAIKVGGIKVAVNVRSVFSNIVKVDSINIQAPEITCEGGLRGINLKDIQKNLSSPSDSGGTTAGKTSADSGKKFYVKDIVIEGGKIGVALNELGGKGITVPLPPIHLQNVGTETTGVTAKELVSQVLEPILTSAIKAALDSAGNLGGTVGAAGKGAAEQINKVGKGLKSLFGK
jgi:hypothetical protein